MPNHIRVVIPKQDGEPEGPEKCECYLVTSEGQEFKIPINSIHVDYRYRKVNQLTIVSEEFEVRIEE